MRAVIMCGGKATRLAAITKNEIPKALVPLGGKPIAERQIEQLRRYGITRITMVVGHLADRIREYFGDGSRLGVTIDYIEETEPLGTAGSFYYLKTILKEKGDTEFILLMGDICFDFDISRMLAFHREKNAFVTLVAHPSMHPYDSDLIVTDRDDRVTRIDSKHNIRNYLYDNCVNAGIFVMDARICERVEAPVRLSLERELLAPLLTEERVYAYRTPEFIRDVGTVDRIMQTGEDLKSGIVAAKNLENRQKAVFLDRDGTINVFRGFIHDPDQVEIIEGGCEALRRINSSGYLAIVITNQPVIARGEVTYAQLDDIFCKMKMLLGAEGAYVDDIFFCPHHPDRGFEGEIPELKIECSCRKPKTGMLEAAARKYNIDLSESWMVGDMTMDIQCGQNAGCHTCLVKTGMAGTDGKFDARPEMVAEDILSFASALLPRREE